MGFNPFKVVLLVFSLALPAVGGGLVFASPVATAGEGEVTERDIADWQAAQRCYGPDAITSRRAGFMRMYEAAILDEVLKAAGRPVTGDEYRAEVARIDLETRAPDILRCIKKHFSAGAAGRYERVFIRPILVQRYIREFVKSNPDVQVKAYSLRDGILKDIKGRKAFEDIASARGVEYSTRTYAVEADTAAPVAMEPWKRWSPFEAAFINEHLKDLKPGQAKAEPIEDERNIRFVRLGSVDGKKYTFEMLELDKLTTEEYLKQVPKLPARINDRELHDWAAPIKGNPLLAPAELAGAELAGAEEK